MRTGGGYAISPGTRTTWSLARKDLFNESPKYAQHQRLVKRSYSR